MKQFTETVQTVTSASASSLLLPVLEEPSVQINDVDFGNLPSSRNMVIDQEDESDSYLDDEESIVSDQEELAEKIEDKEDEALFTKSIDDAMQALLDGVDFEEIFNFLPDPDDVAKGEGGPFITAYHQKCHTLVDDDIQMMASNCRASLQI